MGTIDEYVPNNSNVVTQSEILSVDCEFSENFVRKIFNMYSTSIDNTNMLVIPKYNDSLQNNFLNNSFNNQPINQRLMDERLTLSFRKFFNIIQPNYGTLFEFSNIFKCIYLENMDNIYCCWCTPNNILSIPLYIVHFNNNEKYINMYINFISKNKDNITINGSSKYIFNKFIKIIQDEVDVSTNDFNKLIKPLIKSSFKCHISNNKRMWNIIFDNCILPFKLGPEQNINTMLISAFNISRYIDRKYYVYFLSIESSGIYSERSVDIDNILHKFNDFKYDNDFCLFRPYKKLKRIGRDQYVCKYYCMAYIPDGYQYNVIVEFKEYFKRYKINIRFAGGFYLRKDIQTPEILITKIRIKSYLEKEGLK